VKRISLCSQHHWHWRPGFLGFGDAPEPRLHLALDEEDQSCGDGGHELVSILLADSPKKVFVPADRPLPDDTMSNSKAKLRISIQIVLIIGCLAAHASGQSPELDAGMPLPGSEDGGAAEQGVARQDEPALDDAQRMQTEMHRLIADRRARLLSVKAEQARVAAELAANEAELAAALESALAWNRRIRELDDALPEGHTRRTQADGLYDSLVHDLSQARQNLRFALDKVRFEPSAVPIPRAKDADRIPLDLDDSSIDELQKELVDTASILRAKEIKLRWDRAEALSRAIVIMNESRLRLLRMVSGARREGLEGFGPEGIAQVRREVEQIVLEARFHVLSLPRDMTRRYQQLRSAPGPALAGLLQLLFLILAFRWWWKRAESTLEELRRTSLQKRPQTVATRAVSTFAWYLRRIRKPLEWLLFFAILARIIARAGQVADTQYLHIVIRWVALGAFVVQLIDATASRQGFSTESLDKLRFRSLRLVGVSVVVVGLILSLTESAVGKGAIYAWVASTFWFLAIPIGLILVVWWREVIFARASARVASRFLQWVAARDHTVLMYPAAALGGAYLLIEGVAGFFFRKVSELAPLRRLLTYQFRRGVQKSTTATPAESGTEPLPAEILDALAQGPPTAAGLVTSYMLDDVHAMRALVRSDRRAIVAVVGERGLGKTSFLGRVTGDLEPGVLCSVQCQPGGFPELLAQFAAALECDVRNQVGRFSLGHVTHGSLDQQLSKIASAVEDSQQDDVTAPNPKQDTIFAHKQLPVHFQTFRPKLRNDAAPSWRSDERVDGRLELGVELLRGDKAIVDRHIVDDAFDIGNRHLGPNDPKSTTHYRCLASRLRIRVRACVAVRVRPASQSCSPCEMSLRRSKARRCLSYAATSCRTAAGFPF
jgi:hypothetical protein